MFRFRSLELLAFTASLMLTRSLAAQVMQIAPDDFIISEMGEPEDEIAAAHNPQVAWNPVDQEYLVVWEGQESVTPTTEHEVEIYAVRINRFGQRVGDQIRVSDMGPAGDTEHEASDPAVAYNPDDHEYLVLWSGDDVNSGEFEIHGQRLSAAAEPLGENFRITTTDVDKNTSSDAEIPRVAYNSRDQEYMVICTVDDNSASANNHYEIYGQRLARNGELIGDRFQITNVGDTQSDDWGAYDGFLIHNPDDQEFLVVWEGYFPDEPLTLDDYEIMGQRIAADGSLLGGLIRISNMLPDNSTSADAFDPAGAWNSQDQEFLVVWNGDQIVDQLANNELENYGRRLQADGTLIGDQVRLTLVATDGDTDFHAVESSVTYNPARNVYLLAFEANTGEGDQADDKIEIYVQEFSAALQSLHPHQRISMTSFEAISGFDATDPMVLYQPGGEYLVVWDAHERIPTDDGARVYREIFGQRLAAHGPIETSVGGHWTRYGLD